LSLGWIVGCVLVCIVGWVDPMKPTGCWLLGEPRSLSTLSHGEPGWKWDCAWFLTYV